MIWQVFILTSTLFAALSLIVMRVLARSRQTATASFVINAGWYVALYATGLAFFPWLGHIHTHVFSMYWWRFVGGGLAFALTTVCTYKTLVYFDAAVASIVGTVNAFFTVIGSALILREKLSVLQAVGGVLLFWAIAYGLLMAHSRSKKMAWHSVKMGSLYALLAGISYAVAIINEKSLLGAMSLASYYVFGWGGQVTLSIVLAVIVQPRAFRLLLSPRVAGWTALSGAFRAVAGICFMFSEVKSNNVGLVTAISNFRLVIVILLGALLLKERQRIKQKLIAASISIASLSLMLWK